MLLGVTVDETHRSITCGLEIGERGLVFHRFPQAPVQVQLRLHLAGLGIDPFAADFDHDGRGTEQLFQLFTCLLRMLVAFDAQRRSQQKVYLSRAPPYSDR